MSNSVQPHRQQPVRLPRPWDPPGKNSGVGCHFLLQCMKVRSESEVAQSCLTLSDPMDCRIPIILNYKINKIIWITLLNTEWIKGKVSSHPTLDRFGTLKKPIIHIIYFFSHFLCNFTVTNISALDKTFYKVLCIFYIWIPFKIHVYVSFLFIF